MSSGMFIHGFWGRVLVLETFEDFTELGFLVRDCGGPRGRGCKAFLERDPLKRQVIY